MGKASKRKRLGVKVNANMGTLLDLILQAQVIVVWLNPQIPKGEIRYVEMDKLMAGRAETYRTEMNLKVAGECMINPEDWPIMERHFQIRAVQYRLGNQIWAAYEAKKNAPPVVEEVGAEEDAPEVTDDSPYVVVAMRVADTRKPTVGSGVELCSVCNAECWIAPSSMATPHNAVICVHCAKDKIEIQKKRPYMAIGAMEEIEAHFKREAKEKL